MRFEIVDYQPLWPTKFQAHASTIAETLGDAALLVEHIGSTSVPGLAAKSIIDILLVVKDSADEESYLPKLERAGYELRIREPEFFEHRMLRTLSRDVHIHVYSPDSPEIERYLIFRNRLRIHSKDRLRYEQVKRRLAARDWPNMDLYAEAKTEVIENIIQIARADESSR